MNDSKAMEVVNCARLENLREHTSLVAEKGGGGLTSSADATFL